MTDTTPATETAPVVAVTAESLAKIVAAGTSVTVTRTDGKTADGTLAKLDDGRLKVVTGRPGRPLIFVAEELASIVAA